MEKKNNIKNKAFGVKSKDTKEFKIKKNYKDHFKKGDLVYLTKENEETYKSKGLI